LVPNNIREFHDRRGIIEIPLLRRVREADVMVDQKNERFSLLRRKLEAFGDTLGEKRARFRMRARANGAAGVVQKQSEIKNEWVLQIFEQMPISEQFRIARLHERVEFVDAKQCVFVRGVTMKEFMLHQAS